MATYRKTSDRLWIVPFVFACAIGLALFIVFIFYINASSTANDIKEEASHITEGWAAGNCKITQYSYEQKALSGSYPPQWHSSCTVQDSVPNAITVTSFSENEVEEDVELLRRRSSRRRRSRRTRRRSRSSSSSRKSQPRYDYFTRVYVLVDVYDTSNNLLAANRNTYGIFNPEHCHWIEEKKGEAPVRNSHVSRLAVQSSNPCYYDSTQITYPQVSTDPVDVYLTASITKTTDYFNSKASTLGNASVILLILVILFLLFSYYIHGRANGKFNFKQMRERRQLKKAPIVSLSNNEPTHDNLCSNGASYSKMNNDYNSMNVIGTSQHSTTLPSAPGIFSMNPVPPTVIAPEVTISDSNNLIQIDEENPNEHNSGLNGHNNRESGMGGDWEAALIAQMN